MTFQKSGTNILEGHRFDSRLRHENTAPFISVYPSHQTKSLNIYSHLSFRHIEPCRYGRSRITRKNLVYDLALHESSIAQRPTGILKGHGLDWLDYCWGSQKFIL